MDELDQLLHEAFHTYQIYLECQQVQGSPHLSLLKWPDVAQAALAYAQAIANQKQVDSARQILKQDLVVAAVCPIEAIHESTRERIKEAVGVRPPVKVSQEARHRFPIRYKNDLIDSINDMFTTLETMSEVKYPTIRRRDGSTS